MSGRNGQNADAALMNLVDIDAKSVISVCGDVERTKKLIAWMDEFVSENNVLIATLVEGAEEGRAERLKHLASQISVYLRIKNAANRALEIASGKPPERNLAESAGGGAL